MKFIYTAWKIITFTNLRKMCAKEFSHSNFALSVIGKISIFQEIAPNFTFSQNCNC